MTSVFDGMAGVLNAVFGAPVTHILAQGQSVTMVGIFRESPVEITLADGRGYVIEQPTLRVAKPSAAAVTIGDEMRPGVVSPRRFRVLDMHPTGSPAADGFVMILLEEIKT